MCVADGDVIEGRFLSAMARQDDGRGLWDVALALWVRAGCSIAANGYVGRQTDVRARRLSGRLTSVLQAA